MYLSNSQCAIQEWRVADVNHDGTTGTVDLFPKYLLENTGRVFDKTIHSQYYDYSDLRTWITTTLYNGFTTEVQNAMKVQSFPSNGETLNDKVKCPSLDEVGCNYNERYCIVEGTIYPIFGTQQLNPNNLAIYKHPNGGDSFYWTRSRYTADIRCVWYINYDGLCFTELTTNNKGVVVCIRF